MWVVVVNGVEEKKSFESIGKNAMSFSPDSQRIAYAAGPRAGPMRMVLGDVESELYDGIGTSVDGESPGRGIVSWSPDSIHYAFNAARSPSKWLLVRDGVETGTFDRLGSPVFSPNSQHLAWVGGRGTKDFVVRDGKEGKPYEEIGDGPLVFSPDSQHLVYCGRRFRVEVKILEE
jgi:Tol biopolymer transport system component